MRLADQRILFVDDEPSLLEIFCHWLTGGEKSYALGTAADGQEALEMMTENTYDLLITDVNMPRMTGIELVRRIAQSRRALPSIIFVSGFGNVDEREMYGLGVEAFLAKPVTKDMLTRTVERALTQRASLWQKPFETPPRQSVSIEAVDFCENAHNGCIALGRGGFGAPYTHPAAPGRVSFDCRLSARQLRITGEGYIRWRSKAEGTIGIEFAYLDDSCRAATVQEILNQNPQAFIPAQ